MATPEQRPAIELARLELASRRCSEVLRRIIVSQSTLSSALEVPKVPSAFKDYALSRHVAGRTDLTSLLTEVATPQGVNLQKQFDEITEALAQQTAVTGEEVIAAAVVVLSHSTVDDAFTAACQLAIDLEPTDWVPELNMERKVTLGLLREKGPAGIFALELDKLRRQMSSKSLVSRAELFFRHVKIHRHPMFGPEDVRHFRISKLKEAQDLRNSIVHGRGLPKIALDLSESTMLFLHEAATTAMRSLAAAYRLPTDWNILAGRQSEDIS